MQSHFKQAHFLLSDHEFVDQFENLQLNPAYFTHLAHMRLAWLYIKDFGVERASLVLCDRIKNFDRKFGTGKKFNKTVTIAFAHLINERQQLGVYRNFESFIEANESLIGNYKELICKHYSFDPFTSEKARQEYLLPDKIPFFTIEVN